MKVDVEYRTKPIEYRNLEGSFFLTEKLFKDTLNIFKTSGPVESVAFWAGFQANNMTFFTTVVIPQSRQLPFGVFVDERQMGQASRAARQSNLSILAQVHSHPGSGTVHSDGDDDLILFKYEGMLSIVVPDYGHCDADLLKFSVHQFHKSSWYLCTEQSVKKNIFLIPQVINLVTGENHG